MGTIKEKTLAWWTVVGLLYAPVLGGLSVELLAFLHPLRWALS